MTQLNLIPINQPQESIIEGLKLLLEMAESGDIQAIAILTLNTGGDWGEFIANSDLNVLAMVGGLERLKLTIMDEYID